MAGQLAYLLAERWHPLRDRSGSRPEEPLGDMSLFLASDETDHGNARPPRGDDSRDAVFDCNAIAGSCTQAVRSVPVHIRVGLGSPNFGCTEEIRAEQSGASDSLRNVDDPVTGRVRYDCLGHGKVGDDGASAIHNARLAPDDLINMAIKLSQFSRFHRSALDGKHGQQRLGRLSPGTLRKTSRLRRRKSEPRSSPCRESSGRDAFAVNQYAIAVEEDGLWPNGSKRKHCDRTLQLPITARRWRRFPQSMRRTVGPCSQQLGRALRFCRIGTPELQGWRGFPTSWMKNL